MPFRNLSSPEERLKSAVSNAISLSMRSNGGIKPKNVVMDLPYTMEDLKIHLEKMFEPWMNWENWGPYTKKQKTWQIDHIKPQSSLPFSDINEPNFLECWKLDNLRPLETTHNLSKGKR